MANKNFAEKPVDKSILIFLRHHAQ
jgi:hypothetical protein